MTITQSGSSGGAAPFLRRCASCAGCGNGNFARPVRLTEAGADDQIRPVRRDVTERDDRLSRLAQAHVVGQDRAPAAEQERDAFDLVRKEAARQLCGAAKRRVGIIGCQSEQPGEGVSLRV